MKTGTLAIRLLDANLDLLGGGLPEAKDSCVERIRLEASRLLGVCWGTLPGKEVGRESWLSVVGIG